MTIKLVVTIDTEEDNWAGYSHASFTVRNIDRIPGVQEMFDKYEVAPTYLISYPVAVKDRAISILKPILDAGRCEIGAHCHPWSTPPFEEIRDIKNSMLCNLDPELQYKKLSRLHQAIQQHYGCTPISFRSGRWAFSPDVARNIHRLGYRVDTSVTPFVDWSKFCGPDFSGCMPDVYRFSVTDILSQSGEGELTEVPASIGFLQGNFARSNALCRIFRRTRMSGILDRLRILNQLWLSPETSDGKDMVNLIRRFIREGYPVINLTFHSPSLVGGLTPFVKSKWDEKEFLRRLDTCLSAVRGMGIESIRLSEVLDLLDARHE